MSHPYSFGDYNLESAFSVNQIESSFSKTYFDDLMTAAAASVTTTVSTAVLMSYVHEMLH